mmetsp:Transcript_18807/g.41377  ORF Transcript_18807/g.41377 Transcript_18807/m.41377 type:complete len:262 (+) Transcript_18807:413-1198(+)
MASSCFSASISSADLAGRARTLGRALGTTRSSAGEAGSASEPTMEVGSSSNSSSDFSLGGSVASSPSSPSPSAEGGSVSSPSEDFDLSCLARCFGRAFAAPSSSLRAQSLSSSVSSSWDMRGRCGGLAIALERPGTIFGAGAPARSLSSSVSSSSSSGLGSFAFARCFGLAVATACVASSCAAHKATSAACHPPGSTFWRFILRSSSFRCFSSSRARLLSSLRCLTSSLAIRSSSHLRIFSSLRFRSSSRARFRSSAASRA